MMPADRATIDRSAEGAIAYLWGNSWKGDRLTALEVD
jgi:hypothetical protein